MKTHAILWMDTNEFRVGLLRPDGQLGNTISKCWFETEKAARDYALSQGVPPKKLEKRVIDVRAKDWSAA